MKTKTLKSLQLIEMVLGVAITALGLSLMMKSGLGQTAVVAFTQNLAFLTQMKSGTLIIIFNCSCVLIQILIQRRQFPKLQLLQLSSFKVTPWTINWNIIVQGKKSKIEF